MFKNLIKMTNTHKMIKTKTEIKMEPENVKNKRLINTIMYINE